LNPGPEEDSPAKAFFFEHPWRKMNKLEQKIINYQYCGKNTPKKISTVTQQEEILIKRSQN